MKITEHEMRGLLEGKCLPGDIRVNEELPAYLVRQFDALRRDVKMVSDTCDNWKKRAEDAERNLEAPSHMKMKIAKQLTILLTNISAPTELLFLIGSYGDTQSDEDILEMLEQYNECGTFVHEVIAPAYQWKQTPMQIKAAAMISDERLEDIADERLTERQLGLDSSEVISMAKELLALRKAFSEPVAMSSGDDYELIWCVNPTSHGIGETEEFYRKPTDSTT